MLRFPGLFSVFCYRYFTRLLTKHSKMRVYDPSQFPRLTGGFCSRYLRFSANDHAARCKTPFYFCDRPTVSARRARASRAR